MVLNEKGWTLQDAKKIINNGLTTRKSMARCPADESAGLVLEPSYNAKESKPECFEKSVPIDQSTQIRSLPESLGDRELLCFLGNRSC
jgi:hypothetical protein